MVRASEVVASMPSKSDNLGEASSLGTSGELISAGRIAGTWATMGFCAIDGNEHNSIARITTHRNRNTIFSHGVKKIPRQDTNSNLRLLNQEKVRRVVTMVTQEAQPRAAVLHGASIVQNNPGCRP